MIEQVAILAQKLWPSHSLKALCKEMEAMVSDEQTLLFISQKNHIKKDECWHMPHSSVRIIKNQ